MSDGKYKMSPGEKMVWAAAFALQIKDKASCAQAAIEACYAVIELHNSTAAVADELGRNHEAYIFLKSMIEMEE